MLIGKKLKSRRTEKNLSAEYIAEKVGIDISTYRKYERDDVSPSVEKLTKIANALDTPIFSLFNSNTQNSRNQNDTYIYMHFYEKAIEKYEDHIKELKSDKEFLKEQINHLKQEILNLKSNL